MRVLRCLAVIAVLCGFTGLANAGPVDFHMRVLDPTGNAQIILTTPFPISFTDCSQYQLPDNGTADGCFAGVNGTGQDWNDLQITFQNNTVLGGQDPNCDPVNSADIFSNNQCSLVGSTYVLTFAGGQGIKNNNLFFITEDGVEPPEGFGIGTGTANVPIPTPEPEPILLLSTGVVLFGLLFYRERRRMVSSSLLS